MADFPSPAEILKLLERHPTRTFRLRELVIELGLRSSQARELKRVLRELTHRRKIVYLKNGRFALPHATAARGGETPLAAGRVEKPAIAPRAQNVVSGRLIGHRDGFGFVVPDRPLPQTDLDIFIPADGMGSAMHGDRVEVRVVRAGLRGRLEGRILRVVERAQTTVVGEFRAGARSNFVAPFDTRIKLEILIPPGFETPAAIASAPARHRQFGGESDRAHPTVGAAARRSPHELHGMIVDVEITDYPETGRRANPRGRVIEVLGRRDEFGVDVEMMIRKHHLPHRFPAEVLAQAARARQAVSEGERAGRRDFRSLPIVTIDGETAKDFDDAVHVERASGGSYRLQVHIADVAHYVRPGTPLDREARLRGTSVYFPDRAVPMLPLELSNGICSLNPRLDRLTMAALMEIDREGRVVSSELLPGVIHSAERMTYTAVRDVLAGDEAACRRYAPLVEQFKLMEELARVLNARRERRGSIDFDLPEPEIEFDEHGRMIGVTRSERNFAHRIIEEFMLAANETVAESLGQRGVPALYRIHEKPDPKKVLEFEQIAATFGYSLGITQPARPRLRIAGRDARERYPRFYDGTAPVDLDVTSRHYQRLTQRLEGKPEERILSYLMLRSLKQARYSEENTGHFALAAPDYLHFTSPIRRYPDLIVHRILKAALEKSASAGSRHPAGSSPSGGAFVSLEELHALGVETSEAERRAQDAERELMEWKKVAFMADRLGDEFDALIISLTKYGFFVELTDLFVEGFVPLASLTDDHYVYRERERAAVGQRSKKAFRLGARTTVRLDRIDRDGNRLEFSVAG